MHYTILIKGRLLQNAFFKRKNETFLSQDYSFSFFKEFSTQNERCQNLKGKKRKNLSNSSKEEYN